MYQLDSNHYAGPVPGFLLRMTMAFRMASVAIPGLILILATSEFAEAIRTLPHQEEEGTVEQQEPQTLPDRVLRNLRVNFEKLESHMCDDEVFRTLGLAEYQKQLQANSRFMLDGAGGNWRYYIDDQNGYSLALRSFKGVEVECWLKLPGERLPGEMFDRWRRKRVDARPITPTHAELNPPSPSNK